MRSPDRIYATVRNCCIGPICACLLVHLGGGEGWCHVTLFAEGSGEEGHGELYSFRGHQKV